VRHGTRKATARTEAATGGTTTAAMITAKGCTIEQEKLGSESQSDDEFIALVERVFYWIQPF
jgi:hypothetical protein